MKIHFHITDLGRLGVIEQDGYISNLYFEDDIVPQDIETGETALTKEAFSQLDAYFAGQRREFSLPLAPQGTDFMQTVWQALCQIPYGTTASYKDIAIAINNPKAMRAVGQANSKNPIPIFIPCHRIIASHGKPGGYSGGLEIKVFLIALEFRNTL